MSPIATTVPLRCTDFFLCHSDLNALINPQALSRRERVMALVDTLEQAIQILRSQADKATLPWIENAERHISEGVRWIIENNPNHTGDENGRTYQREGPKNRNPLVKALLDMHIFDRRFDFTCQNFLFELEIFISFI